MVFSSLTFLCIFLPAVLILDRIIPSVRLKNAWLLLASLLFYAYGEPVYVLLMIASAFLNYIFALLLDFLKDKPAARKVVLAVSVIVNIGALVYFKYTMLLTESFNSLTGFDIPVPQITLPLGISFFTFQAMSYVIDVYRGDAGVQKNYFRLLLYISFFPQLIAGPIVRYSDIEEEINKRKQSPEQTVNGILRFAAGLAKKVLIANNVALMADTVFGALGNIDTLSAWLGAIAYMLQIYFDFSGYSDMAIGLGLMFGFHFRENFNYPYISGSVREFWRRWHISLSTWFKEYLYIPLGGNRKGKVRTIINKFIVFACTGIWHGANWTFLLWGLYHGTLLMLEELVPKKDRGIGFKIIAHIYLILAVLIGFVLFRCDSISDFGVYLKAMFVPTGFDLSSKMFFLSLLTPLNITALVAGIIFSTPVGTKLMANKKRTGMGLALVSVVLCMLSLSSGTYNPFIYFRF